MNELEKPIFIVGLPRSGSTLWQNIITSNPKIFRVAEMHFLSPWRRDFKYFIRKEIGDLSDQRNIEKMIELIFSNEIIHGIRSTFFLDDIKEVNDTHFKKILYHKILESDKSFGSIFKILLEEVTRSSGYSRYCVKFPVYVNHVPKLFHWYPNCKVIHITRDPRAIALSKTNDPGGTAKKLGKYPYLRFIIKKVMIFFVIIQYIWTSKLHLKYENISNYALFRYEDLLSNPERVIKELCKFIEIDFVPDMLEPQKGKEKGQTSSLTGKKQKGYDENSAYRWLTKISAFDKIVITLLTKGSMKRFGYVPKIPPLFLNR